MGKQPIRLSHITMAANALEYRGNDATGIALMSDAGKIRILKNNDPAWRFTASTRYKQFLAEHLDEHTRIVLVHTRKYTKGSPARNENNHPMMASAGCIVHNGMIYNDDSLFAANKGKQGFKRSGETDSDIIRALLDNSEGIHKDTIKQMNLLDGTAAIAGIHPATPDKLLLLRDQNPIVLGATRDILMFASDKEAIHKALKPWVKLHNIWMQVHAPDLSFVPFPNQSGWIIGPEGFEFHDKFEANGYKRGGNTKYHTLYNYHDRQEKAKREAEEKKPLAGVETLVPASFVKSSTSRLPRYVVCPSENCNVACELDEDDRSAISLDVLACDACGANLSGAVNADIEMSQQVH